MDAKLQKCKEVIGLIFFLFIIAFLFSKVTWLFRGNGTESREDIWGFDNEKCDIDVILFDGSDVLRFYDPLESWNNYGYTSYNYATSSAQTDMLRFYAEESRETYNANLYVFDLRTITYVTDEISEAALRNWSDSLPVYSPVRAKGIYSYLFNRDRTGIDIPSYFIDIINYHTKYDSLASAYQWSYMNKKNIINVDKGFEPYMNHTPFNKPIGTEERAELTIHQLNALKDLINYCDKEKLNVLFICSPIIIKEDEQKVMNAVSDFIEKSGYEFVDFNKYYDEIGIDFETDYGDVNHVNYFGARKFTDFFSQYLVEKYNLKDHRKNIKYASWDEDYEKMAGARRAWMTAVQSELDNHLMAREIGQTLKNMGDFNEWYECIRNSNYTLVVKAGSIPKGLKEECPFYKMLADYGIDCSKDTYIGVWKGTNVLYGSSDLCDIETNIGVDAGRGTDACKISIESGINIGGVDYIADESSIQVVVYDNNYKEVIDNVNIIINTNDSVALVRP